MLEAMSSSVTKVTRPHRVDQRIMLPCRLNESSRVDQQVPGKKTQLTGHLVHKLAAMLLSLGLMSACVKTGPPAGHRAST